MQVTLLIANMLRILNGFACNLKYSIAKALGVRIIEKKDGRNRNSGGYQRRNTYNDDW